MTGNKKERGRCVYCYGKRQANTTSDRLFACCSACKKRDEEIEVVKRRVNCIVCKSKLRPSMDAELTEQTADFTPLLDGAVARISCGYGSALDGNIYIIAVCDTCLKEAAKTTRLVYTGNYLKNHV